MADRIALIEAGGTKFVVGVGDATRQILARTRIDTARPAETIAAAIGWLRAQGTDYVAVGIASFGPLDLDPASPHFGDYTKAYSAKQWVRMPFSESEITGHPDYRTTTVSASAK